MSEKDAGWYPDPSGENRQRFWDGDSWTEYYTPLAPPDQVHHGAETAAEDYPYLAGSPQTSGLMMTPTSAPGSWPGQSALHQPGAAPAADGPTQEFGNGRGSGRLLAMTAGALIVLIVVALVIWSLLRTPGSPDVDASSDPPTDGETVTESIAITEQSAVQIPAAGTWEGQFTAEAGPVVLDVTSEQSGSDVAAQILDDAGTVVLEADDRSELAESMGGRALDPFLFGSLPAGEYTLVLTGGSAEAVDVSIAPASVDEATGPGADVSGTASGGSPVLCTLQVDAEEEHTITVDGHGGDPSLQLLGPDGAVYANDDRDYNAGDLNSELTEQLAEGLWLMVVWSWDGTAVDVDVSIR